MSWLEPHGSGVSLRLVIQPRAGRSEVIGPYGEALKIRIAAPPVDGAANEALIAFLAKTLGVSRSRVSPFADGCPRGEASRSVTAGASSKRKTVFVDKIAAKLV